MILTALMLTIILPMVGLVIDVGIMYAVRARLTMACDAAALAAARSLAVGVTLADQEATAAARAQAFYNANFPVGTLETNDGHVTVTVDESVSQVRTVTVTGSAAAPVYFMQMLGVPRTHVTATGAASRRDVNVMMVLDRSGSLQAAGACDDLEAAATAFTGLFANQRDRMGMITFGGAYRLDYAPTKNFKQSPKLTDEIGKLYPGGCSGWTGSAQALWQGYTQLVNINEPGAFNVIVFFTDGQPNTVTAEFSVKTQSTPESSNKSRCYDWEHSVKYTSGSWNPTTQKYLGTIAGGAWADRDNAYILHGYTGTGLVTPGPCAINCTNNNEIYSFHRTGANCMMGDASIQFLSSNTSIRIVARLLTVQGGEPPGWE